MQFLHKRQKFMPAILCLFCNKLNKNMRLRLTSAFFRIILMISLGKRARETPIKPSVKIKNFHFAQNSRPFGDIPNRHFRRQRRTHKNMREAGILLHISSLPSPHGIGTLGRAAYRFAELLARAGVRYWQVLPVGATGPGDSPYQSVSAFAGNPYFIDLDMLAADGYLKKSEIAGFGDNPSEVDYEKLFESRGKILRTAAARFLAAGGDGSAEYLNFLRETAFWLPNYALFMTVKSACGGKPFWEWPEPLMRRTPEAVADAAFTDVGEVQFHRITQFFFFSQWKKFKAYAGALGVRIIGDMPIYTAYDSADVWQNPDYFLLDDLRPTAVAGVPPDYFSEDGQLWGNPLYNWKRLRADGYGWWIARLRHSTAMFDKVRIDHFRGFSAYFSVPYGEKTAREGRWEHGPGMDFFVKLKAETPNADIIAEDLGVMDADVTRLVSETGFPCMRVLQFGFYDGNNPHAPENHPENCVAYTGTHDNDTSAGWYRGLDAAAKKRFRACAARVGADLRGGAARALAECAFSSKAALAVVPLQDLLPERAGARMNTPSTQSGNWRWRVLPKYLTAGLAERIRGLVEKYRRG
jgi:4-alpha-glucanotransferase